MFNEICRFLAAGESVVVAVLFNKIGSAPRMAGAGMVVRRDGSIAGSVGGGILEAYTLELAKEVFAGKKACVGKFALSGPDADRIGMICGGRVEVLVHFLDASDPALVLLYRNIAEELASGRKATLITRIPSDSDRDGVRGTEPGDHSGDRSIVTPNTDSTDGSRAGPAAHQCLVGHDGSVTGTLCDSAALRELIDLYVPGRKPECVELRGDRFLVEPLCGEGTVYIFGAGHVGRNLAALTAVVGFRTVVLDDREEFVGGAGFGNADRIVVPNSYERAMDGLSIDRLSFVVIVTRGHQYDKTVLAQALGTPAGYIGMIGSGRKRDSIYEALMKDGFKAEDLARVRCPVGLPIGAQTPEEIAVSILAEIIQAKYERKSF